MPTAPSLLFLTVFEQTVSLETWMSKLSRFKSVEHGVLKSCFETLPEGKFKFLKKNICKEISFHRSSRWSCSVKKVYLKISQIRRKTPALESLLEGLQACNFSKIRLQHSCFPVNTVKVSCESQKLAMLFQSCCVIRNISEFLFQISRERNIIFS